MFETKDQLTNYMVAGYVHLSKKDYGFFNNIKQTIVDKPVTSNQDKLFNKLLAKYQRQLTKLNHDVTLLNQLPWRVPVVETKQEYLYAQVSINDGIITIKSPFNNKFIQKFRKLSLNDFVWDKTKRVYEAPFTTYQLKIAIETVNECYESIVYCDKVKEILDTVNQYITVKYWEPTLVKINNNLYVVSLNSSLYEAIKDIDLNDDPQTFYKLSQYGIKIDDSLITDDYKKFAAEYVTEIDSEYLENIAIWLKNLKVEHVFTARDLLYSKELNNDVKLLLLDNGITCSPAKDKMLQNSVLLKTHKGWNSFNNISDHYGKIIYLKNSRPVKIR
jgi:hypothetical protein